MYKVGFITLGCKVNIYESNALAESLVKEGFEVIEPSEECDVFIINTCSVTNTADRKSRQMISKAKKFNQNAIVAVIGCFVQTNKKASDLDCDIILGNGNKSRLIPLIKEELVNREKKVEILDILHAHDYERAEVTTYDHSRAFVKIQDGCNQFCSYCIIPFARGPIRSKKASDVISELKKITESGFSEVVLAGIHTGKYNDNGLKLSDLVKMILNEVPLLKRLRLSSIEVNEIDDELIEIMATNKVFADHLHLPLQAGSDTILKLMNRPYDTAYFLDKVNKIRKVRPNIAITTDVIVGFPYETDELFLETKEFIKKVNFSALHVFPYSKRDRTKAALMEQVDGNIKKQRAHELIELSKELEANYYKSNVSKEEMCIFEEVNSEGYLVGHTSNYILVYTKGSSDLIKKDVKVRLEKYENGRMFASIIE